MLRRLYRWILPACVLACLSLMVAMGVAEILCRIAGVRCVPHGYYRIDPGTGLVLARPDYSGVSCSDVGTVSIRTNELGFRGPLFSDSDTTRPRVLFLGDSFVQALNAPYDSTFVARVARALPCQSLAAGVAGWGQGDELLWLKTYGLALRPDVVVLCVFLGNDLSVDNLARDHISSHGYTVDAHGILGGRDASRSLWSSLLERTVYGSDAYWILRARLANFAWFLRTRLLHRENFRHAPYLRSFLTIYERRPEERRNCYEIFFDLLGQFAALAEEQHFRLLVATIPWDCTLYPSRFSQVVEDARRSRSEYDPALADSLIGAYMGEHRLELVDLGAAFREHGDPRAAFSPRDGHFSPLGHRWAAEVLARRLAPSGF